ncbi:aminoglycoside phosphotransferase [Glycomyces harbinensis]|uniref:aminoglycoside phosphotransferase n=1 Tax=Glycomyces harbinensis TaxID=58114 RepID=UPI000B88B40D|nr:aminoglycoside phosphotransferase [Glycomyces harbinensis]
MQQPPQDVLAAFGAGRSPRLLDGGRGRTWRAGPIVLKPADLPVESRWRASVLEAVADTGRFRVARPVRAASGDWLHGGWEAWRHAEGRTDPKRWDDALDAGAAFHEALAGVARPAFLDDRDDWWSRADRVSWDLEAVEEHPTLEPLMRARRPVGAAAQAVHGDLLGNVLYAPGLPPAVIDWAPYWRPAGWAAAVAVVDALCWHGAGGSLLAGAERSDWPQMLLRALLFRMITDREAGRAGGGEWHPHPAYAPVAALVIAAAASGA